MRDLEVAGQGEDRVVFADFVKGGAVTADKGVAQFGDSRLIISVIVVHVGGEQVGMAVLFDLHRKVIDVTFQVFDKINSFQAERGAVGARLVQADEVATAESVREVDTGAHSGFVAVADAEVVLGSL